MSEDVRLRQIGPHHDAALDNLQKVFDFWALPFLREWINSGPQPVVSPHEKASVVAKLSEWLKVQGPVPAGYEWFPELANRLAGAMRFNRRNFINIHPTPHVPSVLASTLVQLQNPNNIVSAVSEPTTGLERECIEWIARHLVGFDPEEAWGNVVSGGTIANMTALLVARDYAYRKITRPRPAHVRQRGLYGLPPGIVLATAGSHYSIKKALWFLGVGDENVVAVPVAYDEVVAQREKQDEMFVRGITDPAWSARINEAIRTDKERGEEELERFYAGESRPFSLQPLNSEIYKALYGCFAYGTPLLAYVFSLGTTDTGTIERPDSEALRLLLTEDVYVHADAAAGGFALAHPRIQPKTTGLKGVHSVTLDGHKLGHLAYPNGAVLFRNRGWIYEIMHEAPYLADLAPTLEGSRPGSHVAALWVAIQDLGRTGRYTTWLDRLFEFTDRLVAAFERSGHFQVLHQVDLTTVAIAPRPTRGETRTQINELVESLHRRIEKDTSENAFLINIDRGLSGIKVFDSNVRRSGGHQKGDRLVDVFCMRIVATNPAVDPQDADSLVAYLDDQLERARRV
jgi:glutamate/tyrosine decarboxylase-like PLP-dependent enzyme